MKKILVFLFLFSSFLLSAQKKVTPEYKKYDWQEEPKLHILSDAEQKEGTVVLKDKRMVEYAYDADGNLVMYYTRHVIIRLNNDKSIEENNKVYLASRDVVQYMDLKARSVNKAGKIKLVEKENIKDIENFEDLGPFRIFAFEGIEVGSEVEYIYTTLKAPNLFGTETFQSDETKKDVELSIISPENLKFKAKAYNTTSEPKNSEGDNGKNIITLKNDLIPALKEERYAAHGASLQRLEYKLGQNVFKGSKDLLTWSDAADRVWSDMSDMSGNAEKESDAKSNIKKSQKAVKKFLDTLKLPKGANTEEKIRVVESRLKSYIFIKEDIASQSFDKIFSNRYCSPKGMMRLFAEVFNQMEIRYEVVLTTDRFKAGFDGDFETWNYLDNYLFYFPEIDNYIAPGEMFSRLGYVPHEWMCNDGLFVKGVKLGDQVMGTGKVKPIKCPDYKLSYDNIYADVTFDEDMTGTKIKLKRTLSGFSAAGLQSVYAYIPDDKKSETTDQFFKIMGEDAKVNNPKILNMDENSSGRVPIQLECDLVTAALLEKAGTKIIFKIGDVIGPQAELYQEDKRKLGVENEYNRGYYREISFTVPDGFKVSNLDALKMNVTCTYKDQTAAEFVSAYTVDGNKVKVVIEENYREIRLPVEQFESFRKVINAAADFNKITLFLEKK